jgi:Ca2+-binding RTX toxin-like protein
MNIYGNGDNNSLGGSSSSDNLHGGGGNDWLFGYDGDDNLYGDDGDDNLFGGNGNDRLHGGYGNDNLYGDNGNDVLYADQGNDTLTGGRGSDYLNGGDGNDVLDGFYYNSGREVDTLFGGSGSDTFVIGDYYGKGYLGNGWAVIQDFNWREDYIQVKGDLSQYSLRSGSSYGYGSNDTAIVLSSDPNEVLAIALRVSTSNGSIALTTRDFKISA